VDGNEVDGDDDNEVSIVGLKDGLKDGIDDGNNDVGL
jgi:hypothetical protein